MSKMLKSTQQNIDNNNTPAYVNYGQVQSEPTDFAQQSQLLHNAANYRLRITVYTGNVMDDVKEYIAWAATRPWR